MNDPLHLLPSDLRLDVQRALIGNITNNMKAVAVVLEFKSVRLVCYLQGDKTLADLDAITTAGAELASDLPDDWDVEEVFAPPSALVASGPGEVVVFALRSE